MAHARAQLLATPPVDDGAVHTGHDTHFLARLERVDMRQTELALHLYRNPELVRAMLRDSALPFAHDLPAGDERAAIALGDGPDPPHAVVARKGAFVTCLGAGMTTGALPVLPWARVAIHLHRQHLDA